MSKYLWFSLTYPEIRRAERCRLDSNISSTSCSGSSYVYSFYEWRNVGLIEWIITQTTEQTVVISLCTETTYARGRLFTNGQLTCGKMNWFIIRQELWRCHAVFMTRGLIWGIEAIVACALFMLPESGTSPLEWITTPPPPMKQSLAPLQHR